MKLKKEKRKQKASDSEVRSGGASPRTSKRAKIIITIKREREIQSFQKRQEEERTKKSFKIRFYSKIKIKFENIKNSTYTFIFT